MRLLGTPPLSRAASPSKGFAHAVLEANSNLSGHQLMAMTIRLRHTMPQFHFHVIPRYAGDVPDPRVAMWWVIASKAKSGASESCAALRACHSGRFRQAFPP